MNDFINNMKNIAYTDNGAITNKSSLDSCLDLFYGLSTKRGHNSIAIERLVEDSYKQNPELTYSILMYIRDAREGLGERDVYYKAIRYLFKKNEVNLGLLRCIPELGRWDDLLVVLDIKPYNEYALIMIKGELEAAIEEKRKSLCAKWMPRKGKYALLIREYLKLSPKAYRKLLVNLTDVVENKMCKKEWKNIIYSHVPSKAMVKYIKAFHRNDEERFTDYLDKVKEGKSKINTGVLYPYDIFKVSSEDQNIIWDKLPKYNNSNKSFLPIVDCSGSMQQHAYKSKLTISEIANSLGIYLAQNNNTEFKNNLITFSQKPRWIILPEDGFNKVYSSFKEQCGKALNTDLHAVFKLIYNRVIDYNIDNKDIPDYLLILSDMQIDPYDDNGRVLNIDLERKFKEKGIKLPILVWWNLNTTYNNNTPFTINNYGNIGVGGFTPNCINMILSGELDPIKLMKNMTINNERYRKYLEI